MKFEEGQRKHLYHCEECKCSKSKDHCYACANGEHGIHCEFKQERKQK